MAPKRLTTTRAKKYAWDMMSRYIRLRDSKNGFALCCTCSRPVRIYGPGCIQAGHFIPGRKNAVLYDERNCHPQCDVCNRWGRGQWLRYERFMLLKYGQAVIDELKANAFKTTNMSPLQHKEMGDHYKRKIEELGGWRG